MFSRIQNAILFFSFAVFSILGACEGELNVEVGSDTEDDSVLDTDSATADETEPEVEIFPSSENLYNLNNPECADWYDLIPVPLEQEYGSGSSGILYGINEKGWVAGFGLGDAISGAQPFFWKLEEDNGGELYRTDEKVAPNMAGEIVLLPDVEIDGDPFNPAYALDINDNGQVAGWGTRYYNDGWEQANVGFVWDENVSENDGYTLIDEWSGANNDAAINNDGVLVGNTNKGGFYWTAAGGFTPMPVVSEPSGTLGRVLDISNEGIIVGSLTDGTGRYHAVKYTEDGGHTKLPDFGTTWWIGAEAKAVNSLGQVAGQADKTIPAWEAVWEPGSINLYSSTRPVVWEANGTMHDLGVLSTAPDLGYGEATDINDNGQVVGVDGSYTRGRSYAWVWCNGVKRALDDMLAEDTPPGWEIWGTAGINNDGLIGVNGTTPEGGDGTQNAVLVPRWEDPPPAK